MSSLHDQLKNLGFTASAENSTDELNTDHEGSESPDTSVPVRIQRQTKGRKGKGVTIIYDLQLTAKLRQDYASALRKHCGVGGAVKGDTIELQGDQREKVKQWLEQKGYQVKLSGG